MLIGFCGKANAGKDTAADFLVSAHGFKKTAFAAKVKSFCAEVFALSPNQLHDFAQKEAVLPADHDLPFSTAAEMSAIAASAWADVFDMTFDEWSPLGVAHRKPLERYPFKSPEQIITALTTRLMYWFELRAGHRMMADFCKSLSPRQIMQWVGTEVGREIYPDLWAEATLHRVRLWTDQRENVIVSDVRFPNEVDMINAANGVVVRVLRPDAPTTKEASHVSETDLDRLSYRFTLHNLAPGMEGSMDRFYKRVEALTATVEVFLRERAAQFAHPAVAVAQPPSGEANQQ